MRRRERPLMTEEREAIGQLHKLGWKVGAIAAALFCSKRQVRYTLAHSKLSVTREKETVETSMVRN